MISTRADVRAHVVALLERFEPADALDLDWGAEVRSAWAMDQAGFSPSAGRWGVRLIADEPVGERHQQALRVGFEVLVYLQLSPTQERNDDDADCDAFADDLRAHLFEPREAGGSADYLGGSTRSPLAGWVLVTLRGACVFVQED